MITIRPGPHTTDEFSIGRIDFSGPRIEQEKCSCWDLSIWLRCYSSTVFKQLIVIIIIDVVGVVIHSRTHTVYDGYKTRQTRTKCSLLYVFFALVENLGYFVYDANVKQLWRWFVDVVECCVCVLAAVAVCPCVYTHATARVCVCCVFVVCSFARQWCCCCRLVVCFVSSTENIPIQIV